MDYTLKSVYSKFRYWNIVQSYILWFIVAIKNFLADARRVLFNLLLLKKILLKFNVYLNGVIVHNRYKSIAIREVIIITVSRI